MTDTMLRLSRRAVPGTTLRVSAIGLVVAPPTPATPSADRHAAALLRKARSLGVTTFDIGEPARSERAERLLASAFPDEDPDIVIVGTRSLSSLAEEAGRERSTPEGSDLVGRLRESVRSSSDRLHPLRLGLLRWTEGPEVDPSLRAPHDALEQLRAEDAVGGWMLDLSGNARLPAPIPQRPELFSGTVSLLDTHRVAPLKARAARSPTGFFCRDPFGGGRLDGTRFSSSLGDRHPDSGPVRVRELQREFSPVLRLGFLTAARRRTLAQAAVGFALHWPWVCSVLAPLPAPERLEELVTSESPGSLSDAEVERVLTLSP